MNCIYSKALVVAAGLLLLAGCKPPGDEITPPWSPLPITNRAQVPKSPPKSGDGNALVPSVPARPWKYIVIHHSALDHGNASTVDAAHRARGWEGLGYDFVIDNGNGGPDGQLEIGYRWKQQKVGAHTGKTPNNAYNEYGIGICLIGDFTQTQPSPKQLAELDYLVAYLCKTYRISPQNVIGHRDAPNASTECPGDALYSYIYKKLRPSLPRQ